MPENKKLYKYLDVTGGSMMLYYRNLQFTNATCLNDPFDCHPGLIDFSNVPREKCIVWPAELISQKEINRFTNSRDKAYICSLSKVHNSLLMWSYYNSHKGICIGLDMEKTRKYLSNMIGQFTIGCQKWEVQYKSIVEKPDYFNDLLDFFHYQMATKAKAWEHEQEVRLFSYAPSPMYKRLLPWQHPQKEKNKCERIKDLLTRQKKEIDTIQWQDVRVFLDIGGECFESVYLGINISEIDKNKIIRFARQCNPNIKVYTMKIDPDAFRLTEELID